MEGAFGQSFDAERTVVVQNLPSNVGEDKLTIYFQSGKSGGGDVDKVVIDGSVAFVTFDEPEGLLYFMCLYRVNKQINGKRPQLI
jgi:hypothetical protein